jgi:carbon-monoxide dehydrogenase medium subunit
MKPVNFEYQQARDSEHAVQLLAQADGYAKALAGGQSLGPMLNLRLVQPALLVDIRRCADLRSVSAEDDALIVGAAITHAEIEDRRIADFDPGNSWLAAVAHGIAYRAVRNRGTLGGSLAHADPAADWLSVMLALGAEIIIRGPDGLRALVLQDFLRGPFETALAAAELLVAVRLPKRSPPARWGYYKFCIKTGEFAHAIAAVMHDPERNETRAVVGAIERPPLLLQNAEELSGNAAAAETLVREQLPDLTGVSLRWHVVALQRAVKQLSVTAEAA